MTEGNRQTLESEGHPCTRWHERTTQGSPRAGLERGNLEALKLPSAQSLFLSSTSHMDLGGPWHPRWHPSCHSLGLWD